jgi:Uncharacterized conserved protein, contains FHA domain
MQELLRAGEITRIDAVDTISFILNKENHFYETGYRVLQNRDNGFVKCTRVIFNGKSKLVYITAGLVSLSKVMEELTPDPLLQILTNIFEIISAIDKIGFIDKNGIMPELNDIFIDRKTYDVYVMYLPLDYYTVQVQSAESRLITVLHDSIVNYENLQDENTDKIIAILKQVDVKAEDVVKELLALSGREQSTSNITGAITEGTSEVTISTEIEGTENTNNAPRNSGLLSGIFGGRDKKSKREPVEVIEEGGLTEVLEMFIPSIVVYGESSAGRIEILISKSSFILGKKEGEVDGLLSFNNAISRQHCKITCEDGEYYIEDLESANGTFLNGKRLQPKQKSIIKIGDNVKLANSNFTITSV